MEIVNRSLKTLTANKTPTLDDIRSDIAFIEEYPRTGCDINVDEVVLLKDCKILLSLIDKTLECLAVGKLQVEYLHKKFSETGSGNAFIAKAEQILSEK